MYNNIAFHEISLVPLTVSLSKGSRHSVAYQKSDRASNESVARDVAGYHPSPLLPEKFFAHFTVMHRLHCLLVENSRNVTCKCDYFIILPTDEKEQHSRRRMREGVHV